ncbi:hypothetical protein RHSIM_Rhsim04G0064400 [Rhododendron simsii]|uniref:RNase H type-1 domain-containing protein n=1 Tax=Rhododendron simsii TaxID=118357 RepID=A0A834LS38_RHOSS|nr:hypothetical protein RHSIM_Rhsim04G0064400 [Rhododendron simsii]
MAFNMGSQAFSVTKMPAALVRLVNQNLVGHSIMSYGESLAVSCHDGVFCCIWVMKEYGVAESWAKLYDINLPIGLRHIIGFRKNGQVLLSTNDDRLLCYDCETKTSANLIDTESSVTFDGDTFMESLVLVKQGNGALGIARWPKLARSLNLKGIEVAIDASAAIDFAMGKFSVLHHFSNVISDYNFLMAELDIPTISHTYREGNQCADLLANPSVKAMKRRIL